MFITSMVLLVALFATAAMVLASHGVSKFWCALMSVLFWISAVSVGIFTLLLVYLVVS